MSEKTEEPTPKRLEDARKRGDVPKSKELSSALGLLFAILGLRAVGEPLVARLESVVRESLELAADPSRVSPGGFLASAITEVAPPLVALACGLFLLAAVVGYVQVGPVFAFGRVAPKLERLDPVKGASQLFSKSQVVELLKSIVLIVVIGYVAVSEILKSAPDFARLTGARPSAALALGATVIVSVAFRVTAAWLVLAILDAFYQRHKHIVDLRMTKDEVKREHKESEGDPHAKGERQRMHREILEHATLESVRRADVLVVNPTHVAVALKFDVESEQEAPEIIAKGLDSLALRMIAVAHESGVPVMRDVPLARALHGLELGDQIPEALYEAVAIILEAAYAEREANA
jgi:flagellar biosynthetic protein FlhB